MFITCLAYLISFLPKIYLILRHGVPSYLGHLTNNEAASLGIDWVKRHSLLVCSHPDFGIWICSHKVGEGRVWKCTLKMIALLISCHRDSGRWSEIIEKWYFSAFNSIAKSNNSNECVLDRSARQRILYLLRENGHSTFEHKTLQLLGQAIFKMQFWKVELQSAQSKVVEGQNAKPL